MHYKNGRPAKVGDLALFKVWPGVIVTGHVVSTSPQATTCNLNVLPIGGATGNASTQTASECLLASDALGETSYEAPAAVPAHDISAQRESLTDIAPPAPAQAPTQ